MSLIWPSFVASKWSQQGFYSYFKNGLRSLGRCNLNACVGTCLLRVYEMMGDKHAHESAPPSLSPREPICRSAIPSDDESDLATTRVFREMLA